MKYLVKIANELDRLDIVRLSSKIDNILFNIANSRQLTPQQKMDFICNI